MSLLGRLFDDPKAKVKQKVARKVKAKAKPVKQSKFYSPKEDRTPENIAREQGK